jgi:hypothetical protein
MRLRRAIAVVAALAVAAAIAGAALAVAGGAGSRAPAIWRPTPHTTFQWQLSGRIDLGVKAGFYDVDLFDTPARTVAALHARGRRVACYLSAGTLEDWRPDASRFPPAVVGRRLAGFPDERWLDVRRIDLLGPILVARLDRCAAKGFDAVEADNVDGYTNPTGFPLTAADQLRFDRFLAAAAHARGLSIGLKNDLEQAAALEPDFDWALVEECARFRECGRTRPFVRAGKAVYEVEYGRSPASFCPAARRLGLMAMEKRRTLGAWRRACPRP